MLSDKGFFGLASGVITTVLLQPFQNIKMAIMISPKDLKLTNNFAINLKLASKYIYCVDGWKGFYKGLVAATLKAATGCYIYFSTLRNLQGQTQYQQSRLRNFFASSLARIISTIITNPLSIIETRFQLADFHEYNSVHGAISQIYAKQGFKGFLNGAMACCIKEGFFSGFYYVIYEQLKDFNVSKFPAGIISGVISTAVTHPFQIIRARLQILGLTQKHKMSEHMIWKQLLLLRQSGEWFKGLTPRLIKKPIANTLTFLIFQLMQQFKAKKASSIE